MSQGGVIHPGPVRLQAQLGVLQRVTAVLVQQLAALSQTAKVWQGQVAQYQLNELWIEDGRGVRRVDRKRYKETGKHSSNHKIKEEKSTTTEPVTW